VQEARERIDEFVERVGRSRDEGKAEMEATLDTMNQQAANSCKELHEASIDAQRSVRADRQRGDRAAGGEKHTAANQRALDRASQELSSLQRSADNEAVLSGAELVRADKKRRQQISALNSTFQATFVAPLTGLLAPFLAASDPVTAAATLVAAARTLQRIERRTESVMTRAIGEFDEKLDPHRAQLMESERNQQERQRRAKQIADAMVALNANPTKRNRKALEILVAPSQSRPSLPKPKPSVTRPKVNAGSPATKLPPATKALTKHAEFARSVKLDQSFDRGLAQRTTNTELDKRLSGKTLEALRAQEKQLLNEARKQYPRDKATRSALKKWIRSEVDKRERALEKRKPKPPQAKPKPPQVKPKPPQAKPKPPQVKPKPPAKPEPPQVKPEPPQAKPKPIRPTPKLPQAPKRP
jgi:hypothetical protein